MSKVLFHIKGIPVSADVSWFFIAAIFAPQFMLMEDVWGVPLYLGYPERIALAIIGPLGLAFSILFHEFAHAFAARNHKIDTKYVHLTALGGIACPVQEFRYPRSEFEVAIAGPLSSAWLGLVLICLALLIPFDFVKGLFVELGAINLILAVFNMIPTFPMDGGRVFRSFLWWLHGSPAWASLLAGSLSVLWLGLFVIAGVRYGLPILAIIGAFLILNNMALIVVATDKRKFERMMLNTMAMAHPSVKQEFIRQASRMIDGIDGADGVDRSESSMLYVIRKLQKNP